MTASNRVIPLWTAVFECFFESDTGFIRRIRSGSVEIVRAIYAAVRDHNWATIPPAITVTALEQERDGFVLRFSARCERGPVSFWWDACMSAKGGELSCDFHGEAKSDFLRNRIGFCVLHPIRECAGKVARFTSPDGRGNEGRFPDDIAPYQPFLDLKTFTWNPGQDITATLAFEGDVFEMEDQRNWTDASFKTYCTPLSRPLPVPVHVGDRVDQRITLTVSSKSSPTQAPKTKRILDFTDASALGKTLPSLGFQFVGSSPHSDEVLELLAQLRPNHLRVDLDLASKDWREEWQVRWHRFRKLCLARLPPGSNRSQTQRSACRRHSRVCLDSWLESKLISAGV